MIPVIDIHPKLIQPLLNDNVWIDCIVRPTVLDALFPDFRIVLHCLRYIQEPFNVLLSIENSSISLRNVIESSCDPAEWIVIKDSFQEGKPGAF